MSQKTLAVLNIGQATIVSTGLTMLLWRAAVGVVAGTLTIGDFVLVNSFLLQLAVPLNYLGMVYREVKQALINIEKMFNLLEEPQEIRDVPDAKPLAVAGGGSALRACVVPLRSGSRNPATTSISRFRPAKPSPSSAPPVRASRHSRACSIVSMTSPAAASPSTGRTSARSRRIRCVRRSASFRRTRCCSTTQFTTTSPTAGRMRRRTTSSPPRARRTSTISS